MSRVMEDLLRVTTLLREQALERYRKDLAEEARLFGERERIDTLRHAAFADTGGLETRRLIGADTLWQGWLSQRRGEINQGIALARARQAHSIASARQALARDEAARAVVRCEALAAQRKALADEDMRVEALARLGRRGPES